MCDASGYVVGAILGHRKGKTINGIYYASKTFNDAKLNYATIEKESLAIVFAFDKYRPYLVGNKTVVYKTCKLKINLMGVAQEFDIEIMDNKDTKNLWQITYPRLKK